MLRARFLRWLHLLRWMWLGHCAITEITGYVLPIRIACCTSTLFLPVRTLRVLCTCGREWR